MKSKRPTIIELEKKLEEFENQFVEPIIIDANKKRKETDQQRETRFTVLRQARQEDRAKHPENYPPLQYWWRPVRDDNFRCYYFPRDWNQTREEIDFYRKVASDYKKGIIYQFQSYDMFLAYNHYIQDEIDRWRDFLKLGHVHSPGENLERWKSHDTDEHHLHKQGWYPLPEPPIVWDTWGELFKIQSDHMRDNISNISKSSISRQKKKERRRRQEEEDD
jgi:hypothetical protein